MSEMAHYYVGFAAGSVATALLHWPWWAGVGGAALTFVALCLVYTAARPSRGGGE